MIDISKVYFGCADANTEAERRPQTFKKVFFDPHDYLDIYCVDEKVMEKLLTVLRLVLLHMIGASIHINDP